MLGIPSFEPHFYETELDLKRDNIALFKSLQNQKLTKVYWVWDKKEETWFEDCPVVIELENGMISLCAFKLSEFAIGWNNIKMDEKLNWYDMDMFDLEWREYCNAKIEAIKGNIIKDIRIIKYQFGKASLEKCVIDDQGLLHSIGFQFGNVILAITNGLDKNMIEFFGKKLPKYIISSPAL